VNTRICCIPENVPHRKIKYEATNYWQHVRQSVRKC